MLIKARYIVIKQFGCLSIDLLPNIKTKRKTYGDASANPSSLGIMIQHTIYLDSIINVDTKEVMQKAIIANSNNMPINGLSNGGKSWSIIELNWDTKPQLESRD